MRWHDMTTFDAIVNRQTQKCVTAALTCLGPDIVGIDPARPVDSKGR